ncbi:MAG: hypothetical protein ACOVO1_13160 [Chitinophagaceae bacterium]
MRFCILFFLIVFSVGSFANDSIYIPVLFQRLLDKQITKTDFFVEGSFTSFRQRGNNDNLKADNNIFYTALIAYTLQNLKPYLSAEEKVVVDTIVNRTKKAFPYYKNAKGRLTYNFWRTDKGKDFFPNDRTLNKLKNSLALADDLDDTSIILSVLGVSDSTAEQSHQLMQEFINGKYATVKNTFKKYQSIPAYSTWYGVKMPVDFDFGVHCNILSFVDKYHLKWSKSDSATYELLLNIIDNNIHIQSSKYISPYYCYPSILLYHIGRLFETSQHTDLEKRKGIIAKQAYEAFGNAENTLTKVVSLSTIYKLNTKAPAFELNESDINGNLNNTNFIYYTGHLFGHLNNTIKKIANSLSGLTQFKWYSSSFNDCLLLEYLILKYRKNL